MADRTCLNYTTDGGDKTVIGGKLIICEGAEVQGLPVAANVVECESTTVAGCVTSINAILSALKSAGLMVADTPASED